MLVMAKKGWLTVLCVCVASSAIVCVPVVKEILPSTEELVFMRKYGYLPELAAPEESESEELQLSYTSHSVAAAVRRVQAFAGIPQTGILDPETKKWFMKKRCGVKDILDTKRRRRAVVSQGWSSKTVTFKVMNDSRTLSKSRAEELMAAALAVWAPHGGLRFVRQGAARADIEVSFVTGPHGDALAFDGPGRALAHAFGPPIGAMHFDDDENWTDGDEDEDEDEEDELTDFYAVAVHEAGHALGLGHSNVTTAVMFPYYQGTVELDADDVDGMRQLYLKDQLSEDATESTLVAPFTKTDPEPEEAPDLCDMNYDTIQAMQGKIFVFEDEWMWILRGMKDIEPGYPKKIRDVFTGLPQHVTVIRAIYQRRDGNIVIFSGRKYYEFEPTFKLRHKGNLSHYKLPRRVSELSTVFTSNYNNKTYLIDYERFWRFDEELGEMDPRYPKSMSAWRDVPYPVDAAMIWDGDTYFFGGPRFWRFDNGRVRAHHYYPLPVAPVWFPCHFTTEMLRYTRNIV